MKNKNIFEVSMAPKTLDRFINSPKARGIRAGFEAELCFLQANEIIASSTIQVDDLSFDPPPSSIKSIVDFFIKHGSSESDIKGLASILKKEYLRFARSAVNRKWYKIEEEAVAEYIYKNAFDRETAIRDVLVRFGLSKTEINNQIKRKGPDWQDANDEVEATYQDLIEEALSTKNEFYQQAKENVVISGHAPPESDFFKDIGLHTMSVVATDYGIDWPIKKNMPAPLKDPFIPEVAETLAIDLQSAISAHVSVGSSYHTVPRNSTDWIIEPDRSVKPNKYGDFAGEIVSPPMKLDVFLNKLDTFFEWAIQNDAYTNSTTGFHVGVSLPAGSNKVDYIKLVMFLGDVHLLTKFGREANEYCQPAAIGLHRALRDVSAYSDVGYTTDELVDSKIDRIFELIKNGCIEIASKSVATENDERHTSINLHPDYIEFRIAGGVDYINQLSELKDTIYRYAYAMSIAADPTAYPEEYAKKLYKFLNSSKTIKPTVMNTIAGYVSGTITRSELKDLYVSSRKNKNVVTGSRIPGPKPASFKR